MSGRLSAAACSMMLLGLGDHLASGLGLLRSSSSCTVRYGAPNHVADTALAHLDNGVLHDVGGATLNPGIQCGIGKSQFGIERPPVEHETLDEGFLQPAETPDIMNQPGDRMLGPGGSQGSEMLPSFPNSLIIRGDSCPCWGPAPISHFSVTDSPSLWRKTLIVFRRSPRTYAAISRPSKRAVPALLGRFQPIRLIASAVRA